jgi:hypothetical protein
VDQVQHDAAEDVYTLHLLHCPARAVGRHHVMALEHDGAQALLLGITDDIYEIVAMEE